MGVCQMFVPDEGERIGIGARVQFQQMLSPE